MKVDPSSYAWLSASDYAVAGCATVVAEADVMRAKAAFGCGEPMSGTNSGEERRPDVLEYALVSSVSGGLLVLEDNGFQGTRSEVLRPASKASETGKAASIFWNVNDEIHFTAARRGRVVCTFELGEQESEIDGLPAALRSLVRQVF